MNKNTTLHRRGVLQIAAIFGAMSALSPVKLSLAQSAQRAHRIKFSGLSIR